MIDHTHLCVTHEYGPCIPKVNVTSYSNAASKLRARCDVTNSQRTERALWYVNIGSGFFTNDGTGQEINIDGHVEGIKYDL